MKRAILSLFLALCMLFSTAPAQAASAGYSDIPSGHWSEESVARATELGLFQGVGDGLFGRGQPITRAAFVTALVRLFGWDEVSPSTPAFTDVEPHRWFYAAVETALANGAVTATSRTFRPTDNITREEMAVMLVRALGYASLAGTASGYSSPFTDMTTNRGYITIAYDLGIAGGVGDGRFAPDQTATREQAAAMLVRVYDRLYAASTRLASSGSRVRITVDTPQASAGQSVPTTPLEPIAELYATLREMKNRGSDLSGAVLCLTGGGVRTLVSNGELLSTDSLSADEVSEILARDGTRTYYSERYESAYCIYTPNSYQTATVWYQSEESLAAKLQLARLFGVTRYMMI